MKAELEQKLFKKYPKLFGQKDLPMTQTCMCWGIDCSDGWYWLIDNLCHTIQSYVDSYNEGVLIRNKALEESAERAKKSRVDNSVFVIHKEEELEIQATQVKEKFGGLRFYISGGNEYIYGIIAFAEHLSYKICERCGTTDGVKVRGDGWVRTNCGICEEIRKVALKVV